MSGKIYTSLKRKRMIWLENYGNSMKKHMTWDIKLRFNTRWHDGKHSIMHVMVQLEEQ